MGAFVLAAGALGGALFREERLVRGVDMGSYLLKLARVVLWTNVVEKLGASFRDTATSQ
jgi:hypothetical protein